MKKKIKNAIIKTVTTLAAVTFVIAGSSLDSNTYLPIILLAASMLILGWFAVANGLTVGCKHD